MPSPSPSSSSSPTPSTKENTSNSGLSSISTQIDNLRLKLSPIIQSAEGSNRNGNGPPRPNRMAPPTLTGSAASGTSPGSTRRREPVNLPFSSSSVPNTQTSQFTQAKYEQVMQNSGLFHINGERQQIKQDEITRDCLLGSGSCGQVFKMQHAPTKTTFAVKIMPRTASEEDNKRIIMDLDVVIKSYDFPYIVRCLGYFIRPSEVWICMELMASCFDKLLKLIQTPIPEAILGKLTFSTVTALSYLKDTHGIMHRDVKPSNILIDEQGNIKLCDFGISGRLIESKATSRNAGCAAYMSPERIDPSDPQRPNYDIRADIWSLGITLIELATNAYPYSNCRTDFDVMSRIVTEDAPQLPVDGPFSEDFRTFVNMCLIKDQNQRPKYGPLMTHSFFIRSRDEAVDVASWYRRVTLEASEKQAKAR